MYSCCQDEQRSVAKLSETCCARIAPPHLLRDCTSAATGHRSLQPPEALLTQLQIVDSLYATADVKPDAIMEHLDSKPGSCHTTVLAAPAADVEQQSSAEKQSLPLQHTTTHYHHHYSIIAT